MSPNSLGLKWAAWASSTMPAMMRTARGVHGRTRSAAGRKDDAARVMVVSSTVQSNA